MKAMGSSPGSRKRDRSRTLAIGRPACATGAAQGTRPRDETCRTVSFSTGAAPALPASAWPSEGRQSPAAMETGLDFAWHSRRRRCASFRSASRLPPPRGLRARAAAPWRRRCRSIRTRLPTQRSWRTADQRLLEVLQLRDGVANERQEFAPLVRIDVVIE